MTVLLHVLLFLHMIGWAIVLGSALVGITSGTLYMGAFHGVLTALITGVAMVLIRELWTENGRELDPAWVAAKLVLGLAVTALVWFAHRRPEAIGKTLIGTIAGLTVVTVGVAVLWP